MDRAKSLMLAGYTAFFFACFFLFAYWTFPYERVAAYITDKVAQSGTGYSIEIGDLSPYWITGVELEDVRIHKLAAEAELTLPSADADGTKKAADEGFKVQEARVRQGMFGLLLGNPSVSFDAELEDGEIEGTYEESGETKSIDATLSKVDIGKLGLLDSVISLPVKGSVGGDFDLTLGKEPTKSSGTVKLVISDLSIGDGKAKLKLGGMMGGLTVDTVDVGNVTMELDVKEGVGTVKKLTADGKDVELEGSGDVRFAEPLSRSRIDLLLRIKFTDAYKTKSDRTKALFSLLDGAGVPQVRAAKTPDGALQYRLAGTLAAVRAMPSGRTRGGAGGGAAARRGSPRAEPAAAPVPTPPPDMPTPDSPSETDEEE